VQTIISWWNRWPQANVGIVTGAASGLWVLDLDGHDGIDSFAALERENEVIISKLSVRTGGGGLHIYFPWPSTGNIRNSVKLHGMKIDTRGEGGYVVAPPSIHESGDLYTWTVPPGNMALVAAPRWLVDLVTGDRKPKRQGPTCNSGSPYAKAALEKEANHVRTASEGERNNTLNKAAFSIGQLVGGGELERSEAERILVEAAVAAGLGEREARATCCSGLEAGLKEPRTAPARDRQPGGAGTATLRPGVEIILDYLRNKYETAFRIGASIYSAKHGREIRKSEVCGAPGSDLIETLLTASDFPRYETGSPKRGSLPSYFKNWAPIAWQDLWDSLPDEQDAPEIAASAAEHFRETVANILLTMQAFSYHYRRKDGTERNEVQRRTLISWCDLWAKRGNWEAIRTLALWCKRNKSGQLKVAMHRRLFGQIKQPAPWAERRFAQLCELYEIGASSPERPGGSRAVELYPEFIQDLLAGPVDESDDRNVDGTV
jgi:hypothetical protein